MRYPGWWWTCVVAAIVIAQAAPVTAELQNVEIEGELRLRGRYWRNVDEPDGWGHRVAPHLYPSRPLGDIMRPMRGGIWSRYAWDSRVPEERYVEQLTLLRVRADYTQEVSAVIALDSYDVWGDSFRSDYVTGLDARGESRRLEVLEAYAEARSMFGYPVRLRAGRQLIELGKGWLVGERMTATQLRPFDAIRLTYAENPFEVDLFAAKLDSRSPIEADGDVDFYGVYGTYSGFEPVSVSAYWLLVRDAIARKDQQWGPFLEWLEDVFGVDDYDVSTLNLAGVRLFGSYGAFDYDLEVAHQFGNNAAVGYLTREFGAWHGDSRNRYGYNMWGGEAELGYTLDFPWQPRLYAGGAYFGGDDRRTVNLWQSFSRTFARRWLLPLWQPNANVSFNRLFSSNRLNSTFDDRADTSNFWQLRAGVDVTPTEKLSGSFQVARYGVVDPFHHPIYLFDGLRTPFPVKRPLYPRLSVWTSPGDSNLGWMTTLEFEYRYSEDLLFNAGWEHFFTGKGMSEGHYIDARGLANTMGTANDDTDYIYGGAVLTF